MNDTFDPPGSLPPSSSNAMRPGSVVGDFTILGLEDEGDFGIVYCAVDNVTQREVAVKEFMPNALARRGRDGRVELLSPQCAAAFRAGLTSFVGDARLLAQFDHKALVKVLGVFETHDTAYMVMPFHYGRTLKQILRESPKMDEPWVKAMLAPLLDALETLHGARRLHCDVAPGSILILDDGGPVLLDFGSARRVIGNMTEAATGVVNAGYAPVEQYAAHSSMQQGPWTDIYALAAVVRHAITGRRPPPSVMRVVRDPVMPLAQVATRFGPSFLRAIDHGLAVRPEDRPQTIAEFRHALGLAVVSVRLPTPSPAAKSSAPPAATQHVAAVLKPPPASSHRPAPPAAGLVGEQVRVQSRTPKPPAGPPDVLSRPAPVSGAPAWRRWLPIAVVPVLTLVVISAGYLALQGLNSEPPSQTAAGAPAQAAPMTQARAPTPAEVEPTPEVGTTPRSPQPATGPAAAGPTALSPAPSAAPTPPTGRVMLDVKPWGEVVIDGRVRGLTPPLKTLRLPEGAYRIEVRNPVGLPLVREVRVTAAGPIAISHTFK